MKKSDRLKTTSSIWFAVSISEYMPQTGRWIVFAIFFALSVFCALAEEGE